MPTTRPLGQDPHFINILGSLEYSFTITNDRSIPDECCPHCFPRRPGRTSIMVFPRPSRRDPFAYHSPQLTCRDCGPGILAAVRNQRADEMRPIEVRVRP